MSPDEPRNQPAEEPADQPADRPEGREQPAEAHDESGLDLARSVARGLAGAKRVPRRGRSGAGGAAAGRRFARRQDPQASGAHPDDRDPQLLDSTIGRLISEQGWATDVRVHGVFTRWEHLVGPEVAQHCRPESYKEGRLTVRTDSTAWATQMKLLAPTVLRRLNGELGDGTVTFIDVLGPHLPSWRKGSRSVRDGRGPRDTYG